MPGVQALAQLVIDGAQVRCARFGDVYASAAGAWAQAQSVFVAGVGLPELATSQSRLCVLELGLGLGCNFLATWACWRRVAAPESTLDYLGIEAYPLRRMDWERLPLPAGMPAALRAELSAAWPEHPQAGLHCIELDGGRVRLLLCFGPVEAMLEALPGRAHAAYLDGFAPRLNPEMWSAEVCRRLARVLHPGARVASYSVAGSVRRALAEAGFRCERQAGYGGKRERLEARRPGELTVAGRVEGTATPHVIVIGAGIAGLALAWRWARTGAALTVLDPTPGAGASGNPAALLHAPEGDSLDARLLQRALLSAQSALVELGWPAGTRQVDTARLRDRMLGTPGLTLLRRSVAAIQTHGAEGWQLLLDDGSALVADCVVLASGVSSPALWSGLPPGLIPVRGQIDVFQPPPGTAVPSPVHSAQGYALALQPDRWLVGASFQPGREDCIVAASDTEANRERLAALLGCPATRLLHVDARAAVRLVSADRRPLVGPLPRAAQWQRDGWPRAEPGLWCSVAHGAHGYTTAFLAAELLCAQLLGRIPAIPRALLEALDPRRFARR